MDLLAGLPSGGNLVAPTVLWALLTVAAATGAVIFLGIGIGRFIAARKKVHEVVPVITPCGIKGHRYRPHQDGWRCTICGEGALHQSELSDGVRVRKGQDGTLRAG